MSITFIKDFLAESGEVFAEVEPYLLELEIDPSEAKSDLFSRLFRAAHAVKCGAAFLQLSSMTPLAHLLEIASGMLRDGMLPSVEETSRRVIRGFTILSSIVVSEDGEAEEVVPANYDESLEKLRQLISDALPQARKGALEEVHSLALPGGSSLFSVNGVDLDVADKDGAFLYALEFDYKADMQDKGLSPLEVFRNLQQSGYVLDLHVGTAEQYIRGVDISDSCPVHVLYATILDSELMQSVFHISDGNIHSVTADTFRSGDSDWANGVPAASVASASGGSDAEGADGLDLDDLLRQYDSAMGTNKDDGRPTFEPWDGTMDGETAEVLRSFSSVVPENDQPVVAGGVFSGGAEGGGDSTELLMDDNLFGEESPLLEMGDSEISLSDIPASMAREVGTQDAESVNGAVSFGGSEADLADEVGSMSDEQRMAMLEAELDAAILAEAESAGIEAELPEAAAPVFDESTGSFVLPSDTLSPEQTGMGGSVADTRHENFVDDSDEAFFFDAGGEPDMSHLDIAPEQVDADAGAAGVMLAMDADAEATDEVGEKEELHGFSLTKTSHEVVVDVTGAQTIAHIQPMRELLLDLMQVHKVIKLDVSMVDNVDVTFIQLLIAAQKTAHERGVNLVLKGKKSVALEEALAVCGLDVEVIERIPSAVLFHGIVQ